MGESSGRPKVSVVIPTYNRSRLLVEAVESALAQNHPNREIIVVDDGSTDDTRRALAPYGAPVRYLRIENSGVAEARNQGIAIARGDYIAFLDDDDRMLPGKLDVQSRVLERSDRLGIVASGWRLIDVAGRPIGEVRPWEDAPRLDLKAWLKWKPVLPGALMLRRQWLERVGGFRTDPSYHQNEDVDLVLRLAKAGCRAAWVQRPTFDYRLHDRNAIRDAPAQVAGLERVLEDFYAGEGVPRAARKLEPTVLYYTSLWSVWYLYRYGFEDEAIAQLRKTRALAPRRGDYDVHRWFGQMARFARKEGCDPSEVLGILPILRRGSGYPDDRWTDFERTARCWLDFWSRYANGRASHEGPRLAARLAGTRDAKTYEELFHVVLHTILVSPEPVEAGMINRLWKDLEQAGIPPRCRRHDIVLLHLGGFAQSFWNRRWTKLVPALLWALRTGWRPGAAYAWYRFMKAAFVHYVLRSRPATEILDR